MESLSIGLRRLLSSPPITKCQRLLFNTSSSKLHPDRDHYDNQVFYDNISFGHKRGISNIRNRDRNPLGHRNALQKLTRVRIVDNSAFALQPVIRAARIIDIYTPKRRSTGCVGHLCLITKNGQMKRALIVGQRYHMGVMKMRSDTNNVIIVDKDGNPEGTRMTTPFPAWLRGYDPKSSRPIAMSKIVAIASTFV